MHVNKLQKGFSLIEAIVYLGLFSILMSSGIMAAVSITDTLTRDQTLLEINDEHTAIQSKLDWLFANTATVTEPPLGTDGQTLSAQPADVSIADTLNLTLDDSTLTLWRDANPTGLHSSNVSISNLKASHKKVISHGAKLETVELHFTLSARAPTGIVLSRDISDTYYVP